MPELAKARKNESESLKGWQQIATFLGQPLSVAQRWAKSGMPITHEGRHVHASPEELNRWLRSESAGEPIQIATDSTGLGSELKRGLSYVRKHTPARKTWFLIMTCTAGYRSQDRAGYFLFAFFHFVHPPLCAAAILARADADNVRRLAWSLGALDSDSVQP